MLIPAAGVVMAALVGYACIHTMLLIVRKKKFRYFAYYCFLAGAFAITMHFIMG